MTKPAPPIATTPPGLPGTSLILDVMCAEVIAHRPAVNRHSVGTDLDVPSNGDGLTFPFLAILPPSMISLLTMRVSVPLLLVFFVRNCPPSINASESPRNVKLLRTYVAGKGGSHQELLSRHNRCPARREAVAPNGDALLPAGCSISVTKQ